ncbi:MAG: helix-turn-helix transcriptional regulator [Rhodocyclaceae bacterium]
MSKSFEATNSLGDCLPPQAGDNGANGLVDLPRVAQQLDALKTLPEFHQWARTTLRDIIPHGALACVFCRTHAGGFNLDYVLTVDFPRQHFDLIRNNAGGIDTPIARRWLQTRMPQIFNPDCPWPDVSADWLRSFHLSQLGQTITHAVVDDVECVGSYFGFHRLPHPAGAHEAQLLTQLVPLMHQSFVRAIESYESGIGQDAPLTLRGVTLSVRESEIARLIAHSKSNGEIAELLQLSQNTVKHHVTSILNKTGSASRAGIAALVQQQAGPRHGTKVL